MFSFLFYYLNSMRKPTEIFVCLLLFFFFENALVLDLACQVCSAPLIPSLAKHLGPFWLLNVPSRPLPDLRSHARKTKASEYHLRQSFQYWSLWKACEKAEDHAYMYVYKSWNFLDFSFDILIFHQFHSSTSEVLIFTRSLIPWLTRQEEDSATTVILDKFLVYTCFLYFFEIIYLCSLAWSGISCGDQSCLKLTVASCMGSPVIVVLNYGNFRIHFYIVQPIVFHRNRFNC